MRSLMGSQKNFSIDFSKSRIFPKHHLLALWSKYGLARKNKNANTSKIFEKCKVSAFRKYIHVDTFEQQFSIYSKKGQGGLFCQNSPPLDPISRQVTRRVLFFCQNALGNTKNVFSALQGTRKSYFPLETRRKFSTISGLCCQV